MAKLLAGTRPITPPTPCSNKYHQRRAFRKLRFRRQNLSEDCKWKGRGGLSRFRIDLEGVRTMKRILAGEGRKLIDTIFLLD
jgi:hypothetical protein